MMTNKCTYLHTLNTIHLIYTSPISQKPTCIMALSLLNNLINLFHQRPLHHPKPAPSKSTNNRPLIPSELTIDGYIRNIQSLLHRLLIPTTINYLIYTFYDPVCISTVNHFPHISTNITKCNT